MSTGNERINDLVARLRQYRIKDELGWPIARWEAPEEPK